MALIQNHTDPYPMAWGVWIRGMDLTEPLWTTGKTLKKTNENEWSYTSEAGPLIFFETLISGNGHIFVFFWKISIFNVLG